MRGKNERCRHPDCIYRTTGEDAKWHNCDYLFKTGCSRTAGLSPEAAKPCNCKQYVPDPSKRPVKVKRESTDPQWHTEALRLNDMGLTNKEIAQRVRRNVDNVSKFLRKSGRKANRTGTLNGWDWDRAREMWAARANDPEIAEEIGCSVSTVRRWRERNNLLPNVRTREARHGERVM